jgi:ADP-ribose pyrophosphatase
VAEREVYSGRVVRLRLRELPAADGSVHLREIVEHAPGAAVLAVDADDRVLLVRQLRPAVGRELLELPAGIVEPGEEPIACALRELEEETGHTADQLEPLARFYTSPGFCTEELHVFLARGLRASAVRPSPDADEEVELVRVPLAEALAWLRRGELADAKTVVGLLAYADRQRQV